MSNKIEILLEVDPNGRGQARVELIGRGIDQLGQKTKQAGQAGRDALDGFAGGLGIPTTIAAASAAVAAGIVAIGIATKNARLEAVRATAVLTADAQSAKIEFQAAQAEAKRFGDILGLSNKEAENSFARFLRVVKGAGELDNLSLYSKRFADLAAAYELTSTEVETLTSQLLSGQDEALNRLGISDPSKLYERYAANVGKTVEALTEEEKTRARLLAIIDKGAQFEGAAEKRLAGETGQWAILSKAIDDATASLGAYVTKSGLNLGIQAAIKNPTSILFTPAAPTEFSRQLEQERNLQADREQQARNAERLARANAEKARLESLLNPNVIAAETEAGRKSAEAFANGYAKVVKEGQLNEVTAFYAEQQLQALKDHLTPEKFAEINKSLSAFWDKYAKTALDALKTTRDAAEKNFDRLAEIQGDGNPFVKIMVDAEKRARELEKTFGILGESVVREMQKVEAAYARQKILGLQLDQELKSRALRREADALAGFKGITGGEQRRLNQIDAQINAAESIPELLAKAEAIAKGIVKVQEGQYNEKGFRTDPDKPLKMELGIDQNSINKRIFDELLRVNTGGLGFEAGGLAEEKISAALVNLFNSMAPEMQAKIASGEGGTGQQRAFANAFRNQADSYQRRIDEEVKKAEVADRAVKSVQEDIKLIEEARRNGLDTREADARLLATTGELRPEEQTAEIRQARIEALRREADAESRARDDANRVIEDSTAATQELTAAIDKMAAELQKPENRKLLIEVTNKTNANVRGELYGGVS